MTKAELLERREKIKTALDDILEGGQEFQTRTGRVKMVRYESLQKELAQIDTQLALFEDGTGGTTMNELLRVNTRG